VKRHISQGLFWISLALVLTTGGNYGGAYRLLSTYDVIVYGGTSGGVVAAFEIAREGKSVLIVEPGTHLGGMTSSGLGATDIGKEFSIGGIAFEFYRRLRVKYQGGSMGNRGQWRFEPHVAEEVFNDIVAEERIAVLFGERLDSQNGAQMEGSRIRSIKLESGRVFNGSVFIDASYEGDLMAQSGVTYTVGRESNSTYGETLNGVQTSRAIHHNFELNVDPYVVRGDQSSGLLPGVHDGGPGAEGSWDRKIQACNYRLCLTNVAENRIPWTEPEGYDPSRFELLLRYFDAGFDSLPLSFSYGVPNGKADVNNLGGFSTDNIGMNYGYPDGEGSTRERIIADHVLYQKGLMWTLASNPRVPQRIRAFVGEWGLAKDEFVDNGNWPYQLYIREGRRMVSGYVMTERNCRGTAIAPDSIGMGSYQMDSHNVQRYVDSRGHVRNEGDIQVWVPRQYPISYRSIVPRRGECENLIVPVCLSASHVAYSSIRMEPIFMILGQASGVAACLAVQRGTTVQDVDYRSLRRRLDDLGQIIE
jgi:hypothetical protein